VLPLRQESWAMESTILIFSIELQDIHLPL
jgi:hypothetical protein